MFIFIHYHISHSNSPSNTQVIDGLNHSHLNNKKKKGSQRLTTPACGQVIPEIPSISISI